METWQTCWCDWPQPDYPGRTHDDHIEVYEYPEHEPSVEWNVPEPVDD